MIIKLYKPILGVSLLMWSLGGYSQIEYYGKAESGYSVNLATIVQVDPGPNWKGYYLNGQQNGLELNLVNGIKVSNVFGMGGGIGYLNYQGIDGVSIFGIIDFLQKRKRLSAIGNLRIGYNHIWNQYENGSGGGFLELGAGCSYPISDKLSVYLQSGISVRLQAAFFPLKIGVQF